MTSRKTTCCICDTCATTKSMPILPAQVLRHLDNPAAVSAADGSSGSSSSSPAVAMEQLSLLLLAAVLEVDMEEAAVGRRVEKRLAKDSSMSMSMSSGSTGSRTAAGRQTRAKALAFEYRAKALAKDAAAAATATTEGGPSVGRRLSDALQALLEAEPAGADSSSGSSSSGLATNQQQQEVEATAGGADGSGGAPNAAQRQAWKTLVARFCRAYLGRAVQGAETGSGSGSGSGRASSGDSLSDPSTSISASAPTSSASSSKWQEVLAACETLERAVGRGGWDDGWIAAATLLSSAYANPDHHHHRHDRREQEVGDDDDEAEVAPTSSSELLRTMAEDGAKAEASSSSPWLEAEACLHLARLALRAGDAAEADALLKAASAARAATHAQQPRAGNSRNAGISSTTSSTADGVVSWAGSLSGPGSDWRELALRCLVTERLGNGSAGSAAAAAAGDPTAAAALALGRVDAAIGAFDESFRLRGAPAGDGAYGDVLGSLGLARGSLLLKLGRLEEARSAVEAASPGDLHIVDPSGSTRTTGGRAGGGDVRANPNRLHCRALCVASELDLSEGDSDGAKAKLEEVLAVDPRSADALSRLGWLLLGLGVGGPASGSGSGFGKGAARRCRGREDAEAARPLLEKAVAEEPGSSRHAFRVARYL